MHSIEQNDVATQDQVAGANREKMLQPGYAGTSAYHTAKQYFFYEIGLPKLQKAIRDTNRCPRLE